MIGKIVFHVFDVIALIACVFHIVRTINWHDFDDVGFALLLIFIILLFGVPFVVI